MLAPLPHPSLTICSATPSGLQYLKTTKLGKHLTKNVLGWLVFLPDDTFLPSWNRASIDRNVIRPNSPPGSKRGQSLPKSDQLGSAPHQNRLDLGQHWPIFVLFRPILPPIGRTRVKRCRLQLSLA